MWFLQDRIRSHHLILYTEHLIITQRTYAQYKMYTLHEMYMLSSTLCFDTFHPPITEVSA